MREHGSRLRHVAVVGTGISGLAAAYLLSRRYRVSLFERAERLGGHTHTVTSTPLAGAVPLDTGFLVHNEQTYPNLIRLFAEIGIETSPSDMSFSVSCRASGFEYSSRGLSGFFADRRNLVAPAHYRLLREIIRFNREAPRVLEDDAAADSTLERLPVRQGIQRRVRLPLSRADGLGDLVLVARRHRSLSGAHAGALHVQSRHARGRLASRLAGRARRQFDLRAEIASRRSGTRSTSGAR